MANIDYSIYSNFVEQIMKNRDLSYFKSHPNYTYMLEHVNLAQGLEYLALIQSNTNISLDKIREFCSLNDSQGRPQTHNFGSFFASPTSLRYIWHAHLILTYFKTYNKDAYDIVEIGGGYGGLCFAISFFSKQYSVNISTYTIIDLKEPSQLQELYLKNLKLEFPVKFADSRTFGKHIEEKDLFLISTYCFSEINYDYQKEYIEHLFPKVSHGFIAWNLIPLYYFGFPILKEDDETPKTGHLNKFIYF
jgi:hypothetical protein